MTHLVRWEPFRDLVSVREAMDRLFEESFVRPRVRVLAPREVGTLAVDMYETDEAVIVKSVVPGIAAKDLDISITGDTLTIKGETRIEEEVEEKNYICRERRYGAFSRSLAIPVQIEADGAEAAFEDGVLTLTLPKAEEIKPKTIKVQAR